MTSILETRSLNKSFGGVHALADLDIKIYQGEILGLIGPNGSGKSTFVNVISGFHKPDNGEISLLTDTGMKNIGGKIPADVASYGIARTFQSSKPFLNMTVLENVTIAAMLRESTVPRSKAKAAEMIEFAGLGSFKNTLAKSLPIEQRKRLDLCRGLAIDPKLLLLDEVMAGLNPREMESGMELISKINQRGIAILFIEHIVKAVVALCSRVIVLNQGSLLAEGTPKEVMNDDHVIEAYLGEGFQKRGEPNA
ncbi:MAG TPA: ABC transporter ATP-binding protein [Firmicutes bacterium]|jgi:branched-chain amino acid transport system ATP-binding protein|nr:ABC transporter ATP-binding protein [Bacillota bacterium]